MYIALLRMGRVAALAAATAGATLTAQAGLVVVTVTGTITGTDVYNNSVYFGPNTGNSGAAGNLNGMTGSISITYDSAMWVNLVPGSPVYYTALHQPAYPALLGAVGNNPVRSASFTVNGTTLELDVSGPGERGSLQVENTGNDAALGQTGRDALTLRGGDTRSTWCPNDSQCAEGVDITAYGGLYQALFDANGFQTDDEYAWTNANGTALGGNVRMYENRLCQAGSGWPGADGTCPAGRFNDYGQFPNTVHWVDFQLNGTRLSITRVPDGNSTSGVPEPGTLALLAAAGMGLVATTKRQRGG